VKNDSQLYWICPWCVFCHLAAFVQITTFHWCIHWSSLLQLQSRSKEKSFIVKLETKKTREGKRKRERKRGREGESTCEVNGASTFFNIICICSCRGKSLFDKTNVFTLSFVANLRSKHPKCEEGGLGIIWPSAVYRFPLLFAGFASPEYPADNKGSMFWPFMVF